MVKELSSERAEFIKDMRKKSLMFLIAIIALFAFGFIGSTFFAKDKFSSALVVGIFLIGLGLFSILAVKVMFKHSQEYAKAMAELNMVQKEKLSGKALKTAMNQSQKICEFSASDKAKGIHSFNKTVFTIVGVLLILLGIFVLVFGSGLV